MKLIGNTKRLEARLAALLAALDDAAAVHQGALAALYDDQRRPRYASHIMQAKQKEAADVHQQAIDNALAEADQWRMEANSYTTAAHRDPYALLDQSELQRVALLSPLVASQVAAMPLGDLAARIDAVTAMGDLPTKLLYRQYAEQRQAALDDAAKAGRPTDRNGAEDFLAALDRLREAAIHPETREAAELSGALREAAVQVQAKAKGTDPQVEQRRKAVAASMAAAF